MSSTFGYLFRLLRQVRATCQDEIHVGELGHVDRALLCEERGDLITGDDCVFASFFRWATSAGCGATQGGNGGC